MILSAVVLAIMLAAAYGLSYWAFRARIDRSAYVGLYLLFGLPALLLFIAGLALTTYGRGVGQVLLIVGLGLGLPLVRPIRRLLAWVTPLDPASPVDMVGLCIVLATIGVFGLSILRWELPSHEGELVKGLNSSESSRPIDGKGAKVPGADDSADAFGAVSLGQLGLQTLAEIALAFIAVGWGFERTLREATARLGLRRIRWRAIGIALGCVVLGYIASGASSYLTQWLQPDVYDHIQRVTRDLTANVQYPIGAAILGVSAGVGEELLLRGAVQPRFGIVLTSLLFVSLHVQYGRSYVLVGLFATSLILGWERKRYGTTASIMTHAIFDILAVLAQIYG